ncbi:glucoamylase family protein [Pseudobythopirellula maris]|uniref:glucoamylase family protein n=1 Tax=Pseudobythopirellula maris TaxID=2527991 RepID=UPI0018D409BF|nr:glucoamylase family protein [Pseudobythopirellula maris]
MAQDVLAAGGPQHFDEKSLSDRDRRLLDETQRGCFLYLWNEVGAPAGLVRDRLDTNISSVAAVGFQLSALPIGVERGWVTRDEAQQRAESVLSAIVDRDDNKRHGLYLHFVDQHTGGLRPSAPQVFASTVDHALLQAGAMAAASYFGGETKRLVDRLVEETNWSAYATGPQGRLSLGWRADSPEGVAGAGGMSPWSWHIASAEEQLIYFLAVAAPNADYALPPETYYQLERKVARHETDEPYVVSWNGTMFTYFFQHCWIDYRRFEPDDPSLFGVENPRVDWFENTRRAFLTHRRRCVEKAGEYKSLGPDLWGLGPCLGLNTPGAKSYLVQDLTPNHSGLDIWRGGTVAPYVAASALPFLPDESLAALRAMKKLRDGRGEPLVWRTPERGGYGFLDSFNLDQLHAPESYIGIDVGPMLLMIENARTGLLWRLFHEHPVARMGVARLAWQERAAD